MRIAALAGGVGGAKLIHGLARRLAPGDLTAIVNTGDDFTFMGLKISPDLDTVCYTLAGLANPNTGWGRADETWNVMESLVTLGGPDWFHLGDRDLGTHLERTRRLAGGDPLSAITRDFCAKWGIRQTVLPMTDDSVATWVNTQEKGWLSFQEYFVRERCEPRVISFEFRGAEKARPAPGVMEAIRDADWVIVCPSNPWVSIDPILHTGQVGELLKKKKIAAVSPIIGGKAIKGPAAKMYQELGITPSAAAVALHYCNGLRGNSSAQPFVFFIDTIDANLADQIADLTNKIRGEMVKVVVTNTVMNSNEDRETLAKSILSLIYDEPKVGGL
jgi:LPPG:FO 2-phospho-L-lactate transferase